MHVPAGWTEPSCWAEGKVLPCLTTPAPTDQGRDAPKSAKGKMSSVVYHRWIQGNRQFAPWHYESKYMFQDEHGEWQLPNITTKETLHEIPEGYTDGYPDRTRHRWVANSWHIGMVKILMMLLLFSKAARIDTPMSDTKYPGLQALHALWEGKGPPVGVEKRAWLRADCSNWSRTCGVIGNKPEPCRTHALRTSMSSQDWSRHWHTSADTAHHSPHSEPGCAEIWKTSHGNRPVVARLATACP